MVFSFYFFDSRNSEDENKLQIPGLMNLNIHMISSKYLQIWYLVFIFLSPGIQRNIIKLKFPGSGNLKINMCIHDYLSVFPLFIFYYFT